MSARNVAPQDTGTPWRGGFVARELGVSIHSDPASAVPVEDLVGLALRRNPKRAHLLVSTVLAKHVPTEPALVMAAGELLGAFVSHEIFAHDAGHRPGQPGPPSAGLTRAAAALSAALETEPGRRGVVVSHLNEALEGLAAKVPDAVVVGYAETATGLGRLVANALGAWYIHSTRHATPGIDAVAGFEEGHSHATSHAMVPTDPAWLDGDGPVVLVDDEFSTGATVINTIRELHALVPHRVYVVAALIDLRSTADRARFDALAEELGARITVTALGTGRIELGDGILDRAAALIRELPPAQAAPAAPGTAPVPAAAAGQPVPAPSPEPAGHVRILELSSGDVPPVRSDRFGNSAPPAAGTIAAIARALADHLAGTGNAASNAPGAVVVLGSEEHMYLPLAAAAELATLAPERDVRFSTTTRSPIVAVDRDDYAVAGALSFASHDATLDGPGIRFAYNLTGSGQRPATLVVFPEPGTPPGDISRSSVPGLPPLAEALAAAAGDVVVVLPPADSPGRPSSPTEDLP